MGPNGLPSSVSHFFVGDVVSVCDAVVSLNRLSVGCGTTPRRQSGTIYGFCLVSA